MKIRLTILSILISIFSGVAAQDAAADLLAKVKAKLDKVSDYQAEGKLKTNVTFLKVPIADVTVYYKKPNKLKIKNKKGISFVPKGAIHIDLRNLVAGSDYTVLDAGTDKVGGTAVKVIKLLPNDENADVVLSTLYIDETNAVIRKAKTTTRDNGTYELEMTYNKYKDYGLPDKVIFSFNTKDYKLPKGVTFDFDNDTQPAPAADKSKTKKGKVEISFSSYTINKGVSDDVFK